MRIQSGNTTKHVGKAAGKGRANASSSTFSMPQDTASTTQAQSSVQTSAVHDVSALLALQGVEDSMHGRRKKAIRRGNRMLDMLEDVRLGLLTGAMPLSLLQQLGRVSAEHEPSGDERIDALLEEIGLRAKVEIAKLENRISENA